MTKSIQEHPTTIIAYGEKTCYCECEKGKYERQVAGR